MLYTERKSTKAYCICTRDSKTIKCDEQEKLWIVAEYVYIIVSGFDCSIKIVFWYLEKKRHYSSVNQLVGYFLTKLTQSYEILCYNECKVPILWCICLFMFSILGFSEHISMCVFFHWRVDSNKTTVVDAKKVFFSCFLALVLTFCFWSV